MLINKQMNNAQARCKPAPAHAAQIFYGPGGMSTTLPRSRGFLAG
jgi:flagella synthesis protein FlgN